MRSDIAAALLAAAEAICALPANRTVVVLGRDGWPLVPLIRRKRACLYFLWSRITDDAQAWEVWQREVPPDAIVIDTGFAGSIFDRIRRLDQSRVAGYLLSSRGKYALACSTLLDHDNVVQQIEHAPKPTERCVGYDLATGHARFDCRGEGDDMDTLVGPVVFATYAREVAKALGLTDEETRMVETLTGETPEERTGKSGLSLVSHYVRVAAARAADQKGRQWDNQTIWKIVDSHEHPADPGVARKLEALRVECPEVWARLDAQLWEGFLQAQEDAESAKRALGRLRFKTGDEEAIADEIQLAQDALVKARRRQSRIDRLRLAVRWLHERTSAAV